MSNIIQFPTPAYAAPRRDTRLRIRSAGPELALTLTFDTEAEARRYFTEERLDPRRHKLLGTRIECYW